MGVQSNVSVRDEVGTQSVRKLNLKAALPVLTVALWVAVLGLAAYLLVGVGA